MLDAANSNAVDWASIVRGLKECGWSQQAVADALGCSQGAISQLNTGRHADPAYSLGVRLLALHERVVAKDFATRPERNRAARCAESPLKAIAKRFAGYTPQSFDGFPRADSLRRHVPGDTATPPAPGAVWIGSGDA